MTPFASSWPAATGGASVPARPFPIRGRAATLLLLAAGFAWSLSRVDWGQPVLHANGLDAVGRIAAAALQPDLSPEILRLAVASAARTAAYATAGVSLAIVLALPAGILASGTLARSLPGQAIAIATRGVLGLARAVHELVWAWLFVAAVGLSPLAAVLALAIPYAGILGRILADMLNDVPRAPLASLATSGAGPTGQLLYGRLPIVLPNAVGYAMYRWECGLRSAAVLSFVGLGGLGYQIQLSLDDLRFAEVWTFVYALVALVVAVDWWAGAIRRRLTG